MEPPASSSQPLLEPLEGSQQTLWDCKPPVLDCGSVIPPDRGLLPTTPARRPGIVTPLSSRFMAYAEGVLSRTSLSPSRKFGRQT